MRQKVEFSIGDTVTYTPYEESAAMFCKVIAVDSQFPLSNKMFYKLKAIGKKLVFQTTGKSISESEYFEPIEYLYLNSEQIFYLLSGECSDMSDIEIESVDKWCKSKYNGAFININVIDSPVELVTNSIHGLLDTCHKIYIITT